MAYLFLLLLSLAAHGRTLGDCSEIFARFSRLPDPRSLYFLEPKSMGKLRAAMEVVERQAELGPQGAGFFSFHSGLLEGVNALQAERRARVDKITLLRAERQRIRRRLRSANVLVDELAAIPELRAQKSGIERELGRLSDQVDALTAVLMPMREHLGIGATYTAARETARVENALVILRFQHPTAAGQAMHKGVGKGINHIFHSAEDGVIAGLVPMLQRLSRKVTRLGPAEVERMQKAVEDALRGGAVESFPHRVGSMVAVERDGLVVFVDETKEAVAESDIVRLLGIRDEAGVVRPLVSDVDPFAFAFAEGGSGSVRDRGSYGVIAEREKGLLKHFNRTVSRLLQRHDPRNRYMPHGPENRNPKSQGVTGYPLTAFFPDGETRIISRGPENDPDRYLKAFYREARQRGFDLHVNPLWGW